MSNWLLNDEGAEKIQRLFNAFAVKRTSEFNVNRSNEFKEFLPWFCDPKFYDKVEDTLAGYESTWKQINFSPQFLGKIRSIIEDSELPVLFVNGQPNHIVVYDDIEVEVPGAEQFFNDSMQHLCDLVPWMGELSKTLIKSIIPITSEKGREKKTGSISSPLTLGAIYLGDPLAYCEFPIIDNIVSIAHEMGHQALVIYQNADPIILGDHQQMIYSGVRKTNRPAIMAFHAAAALGYMISVLRAVRRSGLCSSQEEMNYVEEQLNDRETNLNNSLVEIAELSLTPLGLRIAKELENISKN